MTLKWQTLAFTELTAAQMYDVLRLRQQVFVVEQHCVYPDLDGLDQQAIHMLCTQHQELVAYQRCLSPGLKYAESSLGRIVVCATSRGQQLGRELVRRGIEHNQLRWPEKDICISAQAHLKAFYSSMGFVAEGREYLEDNIPHRQMRFPSPLQDEGS